MERKLTYIDQGRSGYIIYQDNESEIKLFFEFGGGNCVVIIYVPAVESWIKETKRHINERQSILSFIGEQTIKDRAPNCRYELSESFIEIFSG